MSDYEFLKRDSKSQDRVEAIYQPKNDTAPVAVKKPTIFSVLLATIKRDKDYLNNVSFVKKLPTLSFTVLSFFIVLALSLTLVVCYFAVDKVYLVPLIMAFCPVAIPVIMLVFHYELNDDGSFNFFKFALTFVLGFLFYLLLNAINKGIFYQISFYSSIENYVYPILYVIMLFLMTFLLANSFKVTTLSGCFLIAVTLSMSSFMLDTLTNVFNDLFITVKREELIEGYLYPSVSAIVREDGYLAQSVKNVFDRWFIDFVFMPFMIAAWGMIIGSVAAYSVGTKNKKGVPKTIYLLLILVVFFRYIADISTTIAIFDHILRAMSFFGTLYISVRLLNTNLTSI